MFKQVFAFWYNWFPPVWSLPSLFTSYQNRLTLFIKSCIYISVRYVVYLLAYYVSWNSFVAVACVKLKDSVTLHGYHPNASFPINPVLPRRGCV